MKITEKKLRQIIREEKMKLQGARLHEAEGVDFYSEKADLLDTAKQHLLAAQRAMKPTADAAIELDLAMRALADVVDLDLESPAGEDPDVMSAYNDVEIISDLVDELTKQEVDIDSLVNNLRSALKASADASEFIDGLIQATEAMVAMGRRG
jgi:hypothetical protein